MDQVELSEINKNIEENTENTFKYTYNRNNKFPINKKDFFEAALSRNKQELDEPLINNKNESEDDNQKANPVFDKVLFYTYIIFQ